MKILSIETSCDETGISILYGENGAKNVGLLGNALASQIDLHAKYGGVFPAMAKRAHAEKIVPLLKEALGQAGMLMEIEGGTVGAAAQDSILTICQREDEMVSGFVELFNTYEKPDIDYIAVTVGPGLEPALWVGINAAKVLATVWNIPVIPVNHMEGHVVTAAVMESEIRTKPQIEEAQEVKHFNDLLLKPRPKIYEFRDLQFPVLALLVSGGHTELVLSNKYGHYEKIGQTRDDAVGEAFDKVARMLGLPYPGGAAITSMAKQFRESGKKQPFILPRPMLHSGDYDFSFSGIKTAVLYTIRDLGHEITEDEKVAMAAAFQEAALEVLIKKTIRAAKEFQAQTIVVGGGVARDERLRKMLTDTVTTELPHVTTLFPQPWLATDNGVMIALAAFARLSAEALAKEDTVQLTQDALTLKANGNLSIANN